MAAINELKKEASKLYKRLERQALNSVNSQEDINRYNNLLRRIETLNNGGQTHF